MEVVKAFVTLKPGWEASPDLELEIMNFVRKRLSPIAMPQEITFVPTLPRTRSGKIVRRVLRAQEFGEPLGDRYIWWNFVSSRRERIEQAKEDWKQGRIILPPNDNHEFIPLPEDRGRPAGGPPRPEPLS